MIITKKLVGTTLGRLGDVFTLGELVDAIIETDKIEQRKIFYHPQIMLSDGIMRLSVVDVTDRLILSFDDHINAIENNIRRMVREMIWRENEDGDEEIDQDELECLNDYVENHLNEDTFNYDGDEPEQAIQAILNSDMFTSLHVRLRQSWHETTLAQLKEFYNGTAFKQLNKEQLDLARETYNEMGILEYIESLGGILAWEDEENTTDEEKG